MVIIKNMLDVVVTKSIGTTVEDNTSIKTVILKSAYIYAYASER